MARAEKLKHSHAKRPLAKLSFLKGTGSKSSAKDLREFVDDPEHPEATDEQLASARPLREAMPELYADIKRAIGRPKKAQTKIAISIRVDADVLAKVKADGRGWQSRINEILRNATIPTKLTEDKD